MPSMTPVTGPRYWRSLDDLANTPEFQRFVEQEFASYAPELLRSPNRRQFLKMMGASLALGGLTGCRWPREEIVPHARRPAGRTPGVPVHYATAWELGGVGAGLVATSFDGRPTKLEGNREHPGSLGASDTWAQASILELYDPDRSTSPRTTAGAQSMSAFQAAARGLFSTLRQAQGRGLVILSEASGSPTLERLRGRLAEALPQTKWFEFEPFGLLETERAGTALAFGKPHRADLALDQCDVILSLDADLLLTHPASTRYARDWAAGRRVSKDKAKISRLYSVEATYSLTGSNADFRYPVAHSKIPAAALQIAAALKEAGVVLPDGLGTALAGGTR
ncbi:MAG: TAT-variant-translocated molybdopterin oxidoreductase [Phycisphaerales bacterium]|nr:TAT-variant-translocated molybdopterin oxidoreductase [Phycisphaerales bacterium]